MDSKRLVSSLIVGLAVAVLLLIPNKYIIGILLSIICFVTIYEYLNAISKICHPVKWISYLSCIIVALINIIPIEFITKYSIILLPIILLILFCQVVFTNMKTSYKDIAYTLVGICYIPVFMMFLTLIDGLENGKFLLGYVLITSWGTDVFAYCIGHRFGKHKFSKISPNKSIEGCISGIVGTVILMLVYTFILNKYLSFENSYIFVIILGIILSIIGQIGDFSASAIKRYVDIKDYSNLLPGHGGMLDRIDSVLFIAPFAYILFTM